jgi:hypothetical protein
MDKEKVKEKIERIKLKAERFLVGDIKAFVKTIYDDYYFCDILSVGEDYLFVYSFTGKRNGEKDRIAWEDISEIKEYEEERK